MTTFDELQDESPQPAASFDALQDETPAGPTAHQRYHAAVQSLVQDAAKPPDIYAGEPTGAELPGALAHEYEQVAKGAAKGIPATLSGGVAGDIEELGRFVAKPLGVSQDTAIPTTTEGGYLGPRGLGVMAPAANPEEAAGMQLSAALIPGLKKIPGLFRRPAVSAADVLPFEMHPESPVGVVRQNGARLLPADVPHTLPDDTPTTVPKGPERASAGAAAALGPLDDISEGSLNRMRDVLKADGYTPDTLEQRLEEMSPHQFLGELSPNTEADLSGLATYPGASKNEIVNSLKTRKAEAPQRMRELFDDAFGEPVDLSQGQRILTIDQQKAAGPFYRAFRELSIPPTDDMMALMPRLRAAGALGSARKLAAIQGIPWTESFDMMGTPEAVQVAPTAQSWDLVKQALDAKIDNSFNSIGQPTKWTRAYTQLKNDLISSIDNHPDPTIGAVWREARNTFAGPEQVKGSIQLGKRILTDGIDRNELPFLTSSYSPAQMTALRNAVRDRLENMLGRAGPQERKVINQVLSPNNQQKIRWVIGDEAADNLFRGIDFENTMWDAPNRIYGNSPTAGRTEAKAAYAAKPGILSLQTAANVGKAVGAVMHPVRTVSHIVYDSAAERAATKREAEAAQIREEMARLHTLQGPERDAVARWLVYPQDGSTSGRWFAAGGAVKSRDEGGPVDDPATLAATMTHSVPERDPATAWHQMPMSQKAVLAPMLAAGDVVAAPFRAAGDMWESALRGETGSPFDVVRPGQSISDAEMADRYEKTAGDIGTLAGAALTGAMPAAPRGAYGALGGKGVQSLERGAADVAETAKGAAGPGSGVPAVPGSPARPGSEPSAGAPGGPGSEEALRGLAREDAARNAEGRPSLTGQPTEGYDIRGEPFVPGPSGFLHDLAEDYMRGTGRDYVPPKTFSPENWDRGTRIAAAFENMKHSPSDPRVAASYDALINETLDQYQKIKEAGIKVDPIEPGMEDPYKDTLNLVHYDVNKNKHLWFFPTESGFGAGTAAEQAERLAGNPLLRPTDEYVNGRQLLANDVFRIVHDIFGHIKDGNLFDAAGEENAWRSHAAMYSPEALPAMTTETRGQNTWQNFGPHAEFNRSATPADTVYAEQKIGLLPDWAMNEGRTDAAHPAWIPQRLPTVAKNRTDEPMLVDTDTMKNAAPALFAKNVDLLRSYPNVNKRLAAQPNDRLADGFMDHVKDNLLWLYDQVPPDIRARSSLWYDGGNKIVNDWSKQYGLPDSSVAATIAAMSPQKDWFQNVSLARRTLDAMRGGGYDTQRFTPEMRQAFESTPALAEYRGVVPFLRGKTLSDIDKLDMPDKEKQIAKAMWIRLHDEAHGDPSYPMVYPEGTFGDPVKTASGQNNNVAWGTLPQVAKAVSAIESGGNPAVISPLMGLRHKVRNFYNNLIDPNSQRGDVTIDTHAVAAGLLRLLSANSLEVAHNFKLYPGKGVPASGGNATTGLSGTYPLYADAYRQAAAERGVLPRQLQSITWEAVRGLFPESFKNAKNTAAIDQIWQDFRNGKVTVDEARRRVLAASGGLRPPVWRGLGEPDEAARRSGQSAQLPQSGLHGPGASAAKPGGGSRASAVPEEPDLTAPFARGGAVNRASGGRVGHVEGRRPIMNLPRDKDGMLIEPDRLTPDIQRVLDHNRERFAKHHNYADEFGSGEATSYDPQGDYNCGRCNQVQGDQCLLIDIPRVDPGAGSCRQWESIRIGDPEMRLRREKPDAAVYGVAANGKGFGCARCPFSKPAKNKDDRGRIHWCGEGGFHQTPTACCELNGAETVKNRAAGGRVVAAPGARLARDGHYYVPDASRPGKYLRVVSRA